MPSCSKILLFFFFTYLSTSCGVIRDMSNSAKAAQECTFILRSLRYHLSLKEHNSSLLSIVVDLGMYIDNPTSTNLKVSRYELKVDANNSEIAQLKEDKEIPVIAHSLNPLELKIIMNPFTTIGAALEAMKGKDVEFGVHGTVWLNIRNVDVPVPVNLKENFNL